MNAPLYTTEILRLAASLDERRQLDREDGRAELCSATCGSRISTAVQLSADGFVEALSQRVHACAFGQASAAIVQRGAIARGSEDVRSAVAELHDWLEGAEAVPHWPTIVALA